MGILNKIFGVIPLIKSTVTIDDQNKFSVDLEILNEDLKAVEFVHLTLRWLARVLYIIPRNDFGQMGAAQIISNFDKVVNYGFDKDTYVLDISGGSAIWWKSDEWSTQRRDKSSYVDQS